MKNKKKNRTALTVKEIKRLKEELAQVRAELEQTKKERALYKHYADILLGGASI